MSDNPFANGISADRARPREERSNQWWKAPRKDARDPLGREVARWLTNVATKIETANMQNRWRSLVFYRHFTGRPTSSQFCYGMAKRPSAYSYYKGFSFQPPTYNLIESCSDVYVNRLFRQPMFMSIVPERGNFGQRQQSKMIQMWVEAGLHCIGFWEKLTLMGLDGLCFGSGVLKIAETMAKKIGCFRVHKDELLYENEDEDDPNACIQRVWANREDVMDRFGTSKEIREAIDKCDSAYPAFYFGNGVLDTSNVIPLLAGYRRKRVNGRAGRYVLAVQNYTIADEDYDDDELPFLKWDWHQLPGGIFGKGLAETLLRIQEEIDRVWSADTENAMRGGWPKWLTHADAGVNPAALGDTSYAQVKWSGQPWMKPECVEPPTMGEANGARIDRLVRYGKEQAHISDQAIQGRQVSGAGASAVAREKESQIDDANFAEMGGRIETVAEKATYKLIKLGKKLKPAFTMPGRRRQLIKWEAVQLLDEQSVGIEAIGMSRFPQSMSGRQSILDTMLANGSISRDMHTRWSQIPDVDGLQDRLNAPHDAVDKMLDEILSSGEYNPPFPFMDLDYAKVAAEAFYQLEYAMGTPQEALDNVLAWRAAVMELIVQRDTPDDVTVVAPPGVKPPGTDGATAGPPGAPAAPGFGDQQSGNVPLAPSPPQIPPAMQPPT